MTAPAPARYFPALQAAEGRSLAADLAEQFGHFHGAEVKNTQAPDGSSVDYVIVPQGKRIESLLALQRAANRVPVRRVGTALLSDAASFIAHAQRFGGPATSVIFADTNPRQPSFTAIYDYHAAGTNVTMGTAWCGHRAKYACPLSPAWQAWMGITGKDLSQGDFAQFIEERLLDVVMPATAVDQPAVQALLELQGGRLAGPSALVTLSRGLEISVTSRVKQAVTLETGEIRVTFEEQHADGAGRPIETPNFFIIGIPVFEGGAPYTLPVRIRYRIREQKVTWSLHVHRADLVFEHAFTELRGTIAQATGLPLLAGAVEQVRE